VDDERRSLDAPGSLALPYARSQERVAREVCVPIRSDADIVKARQVGRDLAADLSFSFTDLTLIATAISELARNIILYAHEGDVCLQIVKQGEKRGIVVIARDRGPGIPDIRRALQDGYSTSRSLGMGLPGARRLMDEFDLRSEVGQGTTVTVKKWKK
jgi:serine/threonine-protein kinase RsbT